MTIADHPLLHALGRHLIKVRIAGCFDRCTGPGRAGLIMSVVVLVAGCATLPGAHFSKTASMALTHPENTRLGRHFASATREHAGTSGFRIITSGVDGLVGRVELINDAERTLDLQYFIFRGDETGRLVIDALLRAATRGVRVRVLIDDGATLAGDERVNALDGHPQIEVRVFNPFRYRGHGVALRATEFMVSAARLDYRMHNKLLIVDNEAALIGGRNIGNPYFQIDPASQFADDDVFAAGPIAAELSATFDEYWNSPFAIPAQALDRGKRSVAARPDRRVRAGEQLATLGSGGADYITRVATGEPMAGILSGALPLVWAHVRVVCDSPDKKHVTSGASRGRLMTQSVADAASAVQSELLMVTPYFIPATEDLQILTDLRQRNVRVRILTNSLESTADISAHSGYIHNRAPLLEHGVELNEIRALLGNSRGSGETAKVSRHGNYGLHAKLMVFDRKTLFIGSMNYDQRSKYLNTEVGLLIDSPILAEQTVERFEAMTQLENSYSLALRPASPSSPSRLVWNTREAGKDVAYTREPARNAWQRLRIKFLSLLPLDREL